MEIPGLVRDQKKGRRIALINRGSMNILSISSILPIPGIRVTNDFVFQTYINYRENHPDDTVVILKPVRYSLNPLAILKGTTRLSKYKRQYRREVHGFHVEIIPFFSAWKAAGLHSIVTRSIYWLNRRRIRDLFTRYRFDIIHGQYIISDGLLARRLSRIYRVPYFVTSHNELRYFDHRISAKTAQGILRGASKVLPLSYFNYQYFLDLGLVNVVMSPLGFNEEFIRPQKTETGSVVKIFTAAYLIKLKNIDKVITAVARLSRKHRISFTIYGEGPEREILEKLVESEHLEGIVTFRGKVAHEQMADEMYKHDIFIMPSFFETFGRVYFEAMAMAIPVICARNSGIYGLFKEREEGISVKHDDMDDITGALEYLIADPAGRLRIGRNGQDLVKSYTWRQVSRTLHSHYTASLESSSQSSDRYSPGHPSG